MEISTQDADSKFATKINKRHISDFKGTCPNGVRRFLGCFIQTGIDTDTGIPCPNRLNEKKKNRFEIEFAIDYLKTCIKSMEQTRDVIDKKCYINMKHHSSVGSRECLPRINPFFTGAAFNGDFLNSGDPDLDAA